MLYYNFLNYIDPGTGSMLFTVIIGVVTAAVFLVRGLMIKFKYKLHAGKVKEDLNKVPYVIFSDHKRYWNVFKPICDEFEKRQIKCEYWTMSEDDPALECGYEFVETKFIGTGNSAFAKLNMMNAAVCLSTTPGLDVLQWKRSKDVNWYVHTYHYLGDGQDYKMFALDYYDAVLATGSIQEPVIRNLEQQRNLPAKEVVIVGSTYMDENEKRAVSLQAANTDRKTVLLAPSWGSSSILSRFGERFIQCLVDTGYRIIIRPHPQSKTAEADMLERLQNAFPDGENVNWNYDNDNFKVLSESDILISDFSGVMFDYAFTFNRPFIYADTSFDKAPYDADWIEGMPWTFEAIKKIGRELKEEDFDRIKEILDEVMTEDKYSIGREECKNAAWMCRGEAAARTVDYMANKYKELLEPKPETTADNDDLT